MNLQASRTKHPVFTYRSFETSVIDRQLDLRFNFSIAPDLEFHPHISLPLVDAVDPAAGHNLIFHLGLIEAVSYWKSTCSPQLIIEAGRLTPEQLLWWHDLFIHGLGEFFYRNDLDFTTPDFLTLSCSPGSPTLNPPPARDLKGDLILVGGGKDSVVTLTQLKGGPNKQNVLLLNPTPAALETSRLAGFTQPLIVKREIDPGLLALNRQGYFNGHTPFSAYLAFLAVLMGHLHGYRNIITSNEASAGEGNINFHQLEVNHQYSKSYRFESRFRDYLKESLSPDSNYYSFLRPLSELQIAGLFAKNSKYDQAFVSCNTTKNRSWCGRCPKCAFVYLTLSAFMSPQRLVTIFGPEDFSTHPQIQTHIFDLVGLGDHKPFDCVGTVEESRAAVALTIFKNKRLGIPVPVFLGSLDQKLQLTQNTTEAALLDQLQTGWNQENFLPLPAADQLREALKTITL